MAGSATGDERRLTSQRTESGSKCLQFCAEGFDDLANGFLVAAVPAPLALLGGFHQSGLGEDGHVMGDSRLREVDALLDVPGTEAGVHDGGFAVRFLGSRTVAQGEQDTSASRICDGVEGAVERLVRGHA